MRYRAEIRFHKAAKLEVLEAESLIAEVLGIGAGGGKASQPTSTSTASSAAPATAAPAAAPPVAAPAPAPAPAYTAPAAPPPAPADTAMAPIAPPPPPPQDQPVAPPPTIAAGMTIDQVVAALGQPVRMVDLGARKIYSYPNLKVTFLNGKVSLGDDSSDTPDGSSGSHMLLYELGLGALILGAAAFLFLRSRRPAVAVPSGPPPAMPYAAMPPPVQAPLPPAAVAAAAPQSPPPAASAAPVNLIERLEELEKLRDRGILTQAEFDREKAKLKSL